MRNPGWIVDRISSIGIRESIWIGISVFVTYLISNVLTVYMMFRTVMEQIPEQLVSAYDQVLTVMSISTSVGVVFGDIATFVLGWAFIVIAVMLLNGRRYHRALFGWLSIGYLPLALYSACAVMFLVLFSDAMVHEGLTSISTIEQLPVEIGKMQDSGWFGWVRLGRYLAYGLTLTVACEVVHRLSALTRLKCVGILSAYAGLHVFITMIVF
ncbi:MAG: hypothetical protein F4Z81_12380 [Gemmatimonadetes bacterium]|nr:hypothetical protein [Gemmatimonadota bacterium]MYB60095.1 hypothetical protein [Gemmatimonadota bacterium]